VKWESVYVAAKLGTRSPPQDLKALQKPFLQDPHDENYFQVLAQDSHLSQANCFRSYHWVC